MAIFGVLWRDDSRKMDEVELINTARLIFERKCGEKANLALISLAAPNVPEMEGMLVSRSHLVFPNHALVGVTIKDDETQWKLIQPR